MGIAETLALPMKLPLPRTSSVESSKNIISVNCRNQLESISQLNLLNFGKGRSSEPGIFELPLYDHLLSEIILIISADACKDISTHHPTLMVILKALSNMQKWCQLSKNISLDQATERSVSPSLDLPNESPMGLCLSEFSSLRFLIADIRTKNIPLSQVDDVPTLFNKLFAHLQKKSQDLPVLRAIAERILELEPNNINAASIVFQIAYSQWRKGESLDSRDFAAFYDRVSSLTGGYYTHLRLDYALANENYNDVQDIARQQLKTEAPNIGHYYLAWLAYREGNIDKAREYLEELMNGYYVDYKPEAYLALKKLNSVEDSEEFSWKLNSPGVRLHNPVYLLPPNSQGFAYVTGNASSIELVPNLPLVDPKEPNAQKLVEEAWETMIARDTSSSKIKTSPPERLTDGENEIKKKIDQIINSEDEFSY